jgi:hypothetical protein
MDEPKMTSDRDEVILWLGTAIRSVAKDELGLALIDIHYALDDLEKLVKAKMSN